VEENGRETMKSTVEVKVRNQVGLHARPATLFVKEAAKFKSKIIVENLTQPSREINGRSLINLMSLGVEKDHTIRITAEGEDYQQAIIALVSLIERNFNED
jgi:phosphocarrier protein HPr